MLDGVMVSLGHDLAYYAERKVHIDRRGGVVIDPTSVWGSFITVLTVTQDPSNMDTYRARPVTVGPHAYIGSNVVLYNCIIGEGAVVAAGTVVRSCEVYPWVMVAGNPAQVIARCKLKQPGAEWTYFADKKWGVLF